MSNLVEINIPAYDELLNLTTLIPQIQAVLREETSFDFIIKIVVRLDESTEVTRNLEAFGVKVLKRHPDNSFGSAIRTAVTNLEDDSLYTVFMDADGSHNPKRLTQLVNSMESGDYDVVIASRYIAGGQTDNGKVLILLSRILNRIYSFAMHIDCKDVSTNFKIYRTSILRGLDLKCKNFDIVEELLFMVNARRNFKLRFLEIPDHFEARKTGISKRKLGPFIITYVLTLIKLRFRIHREHSNFRG